VSAGATGRWPAQGRMADSSKDTQLMQRAPKAAYARGASVSGCDIGVQAVKEGLQADHFHTPDAPVNPTTSCSTAWLNLPNPHATITTGGPVSRVPSTKNSLPLAQQCCVLMCWL
jgi:hypothetical protein